MAKFDPFLSLDCARVEGVGAQSKERKGYNFAAWRSGAIVQKPKGPNTNGFKNPAIAIWQPCLGTDGGCRQGELLPPPLLALQIVIEVEAPQSAGGVDGGGTLGRSRARKVRMDMHHK